jgi:hypothetical protein
VQSSASAPAPHTERAALAAKQALAERVAALGAVTLRAAAAARGIDPDSAGMWAKRGLSRSAFRGPRGVWCVREAEFDAELEAWRCSWDGCDRFALLSAAGRCHEHAGRPKPDGRLRAEEFAAKHGLHLAYLLERLAAGEIPAQRVDRQGGPVERDRFHATWRITEQEALEALDERFRCNTDGCDGHALGPSGYCAACTTARMQAARWPESPGKIRKACAECGSVREVYPSLQRAGDLCFACWTQRRFDDLMYRAAWINARHGLRWARRACGQANAARSAAKGTKMVRGRGKGPILTPPMQELIATRRAEGQSDRAIAREIHVSDATVRRFRPAS